MRFVTLKDVNIHSSRTFDLRPGDTVLASSFRKPIMLARSVKGKKHVVFGFDPKGSDLPMRVAFPMLMVNTFDWFSGDTNSLVTSYRTGDTWYVPINRSGSSAKRLTSVDIKDPQGTRFTAPVSDGRVVLYGKHAGVYEISGPGLAMRIAANLSDPQESNIKPHTLSVRGERANAPTGFSSSLRREIWIYLLLAALVLLLVEWATYNRRITV